jgi:hypothetical protein
VSLQQRHTEFFFKLVQAARDGWLGQRLRPRAAANAAGIGHGEQMSQLMQLHE